MNREMMLIAQAQMQMEKTPNKTLNKTKQNNRGTKKIEIFFGYIPSWK